MPVDPKLIRDLEARGIMDTSTTPRRAVRTRTEPPKDEPPICDGGPSVRHVWGILNGTIAEARNQAAKLLKSCRVLEPPGSARQFPIALDREEEMILHICDMIVAYLEKEGDLSRVMSALKPVVPQLDKWGKFLKLLGRVDSDEIDISQFETLCKMLKASMVNGFASSSRFFKNGSGWVLCQDNDILTICQKCRTLFVNIRTSGFLVAAIVPVIRAFESLPRLTTTISRKIRHEFELLSEWMLKTIQECEHLGAIGELAHAIVLCANLGQCMDVAASFVVFDIAQKEKVADNTDIAQVRFRFKDVYSVPRLSALYSSFDLSQTCVGEVALDFAVLKADGKFCVVELLGLAWPSSVVWLLSLRAEMKKALGGLGLSEWDSCCMEQIYLHVAHLHHDQVQQDTLSQIMVAVCEKLAVMYSREEDQDALLNWFKRGLSFWYFGIPVNLLFMEFCMCPFLNALPDAQKIFLGTQVPVLLGPSALGLSFRLMMKPPCAEAKRELDRLYTTLLLPKFSTGKAPATPVVNDSIPNHVLRSTKLPNSTRLKEVTSNSKAQATVGVKDDIRDCSPRKTKAPTSSITKQVRVHGHLVCKHNRRLSMCSECNGGSICVHNKQRHWCSDCGGGARCIHGKQKSRCADCGGKGICEHGRLRWRCTLCNKH